MSKFQNYIKSLNVVNTITPEDLDNTLSLLNMYAPLVRLSLQQVDEFTEECFESRRQSVSDFISLAIDFDHDVECKRISERLASTGHSMQLLAIMDKALILVRYHPKNGELYYRILHARYFDCDCKSNEDAFLKANVASSTFYRHIKNAQKLYAAMLWCVVIPDLVISFKANPHEAEEKYALSKRETCESLVGVS